MPRNNNSQKQYGSSFVHALGARMLPRKPTLAMYMDVALGKFHTMYGSTYLGESSYTHHRQEHEQW